METHWSDVDEPARKRMRKGTRCCVECRRRKVRCVFQDAREDCNECFSRKIHCVKQTEQTQDRAKEKSARQWIEKIVQQTVQDHPSQTDLLQGMGYSQTSPNNLAQPANSISSYLSGSFLPPKSPSARHRRTVHENKTRSGSSHPYHDSPANRPNGFSQAPLLSVFNDVASGQEKHYIDGQMDSPSWSLSRSEYQILQNIKLQIPDIKVLSSILEDHRHSWDLWQHTFNRELEVEHLDEYEKRSKLINFIYTSIHSDHIGRISKIILCLVLQIQQMDTDLESLLHTLFSSICTLLETEDGLAGTLDGLRCIMFQTEFYINAGNMRKVWLLTRRAVNVAQLLGIHQCLPEQDSNPRLQVAALWEEIWHKDRGFSLLLGLPYSVPESLCLNSYYSSPEGSNTGSIENFLNRLSIIMGHIIDRNQGRSKMNYSVTLGIDEQLEECKSMMPESFWQTQVTHRLPLENSFDLFSARMRFYKVRKILHLPYLLKSYTNGRYSESRAAVLDSAKSMIQAYHTLRDIRQPILKMCDMAEFEVLSATLIIIVDAFSSQPHSFHDQAQSENHWKIVLGVLEELQQLSKTRSCTIVTQSVRLLRDLYTFHQNPTSSGDTCEIAIPYFGKVSIRRQPIRLGSQTQPQTQEESNNTEETITLSTNYEQHTRQDSQDVGISPDCLMFTPNGYLYPTPGILQPWQQQTGRNTASLGWDSMNDSYLIDSWNWFPQFEDEMNPAVSSEQVIQT